MASAPSFNVELSETNSPRHQKIPPIEEKQEVDYMQRAQWLRAALLGANDGLVTVASLMMGVGSIKEDVKAMLLVGFAGLVAGACSMAIGEFVSVCTQRDIETAQMKRAIETKTSLSAIDEQEEVMLRIINNKLYSQITKGFRHCYVFSCNYLLQLVRTVS